MAGRGSHHHTSGYASAALGASRVASRCCRGYSLEPLTLTARAPAVSLCRAGGRSRLLQQQQQQQQQQRRMIGYGGDSYGGGGQARGSVCLYPYLCALLAV